MGRVRHPVVNERIETEAEFCGGSRQGHEGIPGADAIGGVGSKTDQVFANACACAKFSRVVVEGDFGMASAQPLYDPSVHHEVTGAVAHDDW